MNAANATSPERATSPDDPAGGSALVRFCASLRYTARIAALFCLFVSAAMLYQHARATERDPWKSPQLLALKEKLRAAPADEAVKTEIRRLDLEFRERYQRRLALNVKGSWLLVGGMVVLLVAAKPVVRFEARPWRPRLRPDAANVARRERAQARWSVAAVGGVTLLGLLALALTASSPVPRTLAELEKLLGNAEAPPEGSAVTIRELMQQWPQFRGLDGGRTTNALAFDARTAVVAWQTASPATGFNSPIVWSNRLFISGGNAAKREVFAFDVSTGGLLWRRAIESGPGAPARPPEIPEATGWAAPTMATDGRRVFALFANGDLAAVSVEGAIIWTKNLGVPKNMYGHASSLAILPDRVIVQLDQDEEAPGGSRLLAFDSATGRKLWDTAKPTHGSWASPLIAGPAAAPQIITLALPLAMSHSPTDGRELWRAAVMDGEIAPSPISVGDLIVMVSPSGKLIAVRGNGAGDVTGAAVAWETEATMPDITSPVSDGELIYLVTSLGEVTGFDARDGKQVWQHNLDFEVQASPAIAGRQLIILSTAGDVVSVECGRAFKELGRTKLADAFYASPAFGADRMFLRGTTNLWCLAQPKP